jgi:hypothetical protein
MLNKLEFCHTIAPETSGNVGNFTRLDISTREMVG